MRLAITSSCAWQARLAHLRSTHSCGKELYVHYRVVGCVLAFSRPPPPGFSQFLFALDMVVEANARERGGEREKRREREERETEKRVLLHGASTSDLSILRSFLT